MWQMSLLEVSNWMLWVMSQKCQVSVGVYVWNSIWPFVCVRECVNMWVCECVCVCSSVCESVCMCVSVWVCVSLCVSVWGVWVYCVNVTIYECVSVCEWVYVYQCVYLCASVCVLCMCVSVHACEFVLSFVNYLHILQIIYSYYPFWQDLKTVKIMFNLKIPILPNVFLNNVNCLFLTR
jgi:hypothetical protein